jgi:hypothetical protein
LADISAPRRKASGGRGASPPAVPAISPLLLRSPKDVTYLDFFPGDSTSLVIRGHVFHHYRILITIFLTKMYVMRYTVFVFSLYLQKKNYHFYYETDTFYYDAFYPALRFMREVLSIG